MLLSQNDKAECRQDCGEDMRDCMSVGCCSHYFEAGKLYEIEIINELYSNSYGELCLNFRATVLNGQTDGYDAPCGVEFFNPEAFNRYFRIKEAEGN